jgi:2-iminobutanoate/2-iminopropanoate deaminase|tara:strand:- start:167 stop:547 length:381 start_codon:yes stop_codon:yes gene_type:complete
MTRKIIESDKAPKAIGAYAPAVDLGDFVFLSGQIPLDPETMELVSGDIRVQTARVLENMKAVLEAAGLTPENVVRTTVFLTDLNDFAVLNEVYGEFFGAAPPARSTIQVSALPKGASVEIDAIARR